MRNKKVLTCLRAFAQNDSARASPGVCGQSTCQSSILAEAWSLHPTVLGLAHSQRSEVQSLPCTSMESARSEMVLVYLPRAQEWAGKNARIKPQNCL